MNSKERIYATIKGLPCDRVPVTPIFMAWAANFIHHTYRDYYLDGDVLVKSQLAVTRFFKVDQISAISDPWREASAYGMEFDYPADGVGKPRNLLLKNPSDIAALKRLDVANSFRMSQRVESVRALALEVGRTHSVLGWVEGPLAEYSDLRGLETAMMDLMDRPELFMRASEIIVQNAIDFAVAQIEAGADMIGIGDAAASLIGRELYSQYVLPCEKRLVDAVHNAGGTVKLHICGNIGGILEPISQTGTDILDVDWMVPLDSARKAVGPKITLCGNMDPSSVILQGTPEQIEQAARQCVSNGGDRFILMPGCEVPPHTPVENIQAFCPCQGCMIPDLMNLVLET